MARGSAHDVDLAVRAARRSFDDGVWAFADPRERKRVLLRWASLIDDHAEELAQLESADVGHPITDARNVDVPNARNCIAWYAEAIDKVYGEIAPTGADALALVGREPLGVVGAVIPWNYPLIITAWKLAPALVWINTFDASSLATPFGGVKDSGHGRDRSLHALDAYTHLKTTWVAL